MADFCSIFRGFTNNYHEEFRHLDLILLSKLQYVTRLKGMCNFGNSRVLRDSNIAMFTLLGLFRVTQNAGTPEITHPLFTFKVLLWKFFNYFSGLYILASQQNPPPPFPCFCGFLLILCSDKSNSSLFFKFEKIFPPPGGGKWPKYIRLFHALTRFID